MSRRRLALLLATITGLALIVAACGGSDESSAPADGEPVTAAAETETEATSTPVEPIPVTEPGTRETVTLEIAGNDVTVTIVLPNDYSPGQPYPILFALPPGGQSQNEVDFGLDAYWAGEARARGWIVVSPAAPDGALFFQGSEAIVPELLDTIAASYRPENDVFHVSGISNGGLSAFRVALQSPERFASVVVLPGFPPTEGDFAQLDRLAGTPVRLYVGETDTKWVEGAARARAELEALNGDVTLTIEPDGGHILRDVTGADLFEVLDAAR